MIYIDAHCHLERQYFGDELDDVIERAEKAGLSHMVAVGASGVTSGAEEAVALAERVDSVYAAVGLHPHEAAKATAEAARRIAELLGHPKVVALGEIGLDYHYDFSPPDTQRELFAGMLALGRARNVPVMLHTREAHVDTVGLLDAVGLPERGGVVHCFTGTPEEARDYLDRGLYLSIPGVVTFRNARALQDAVGEMPLERLLIETDAPYLAPVPHRGKRNEPMFVKETAAAIAEIRGLSPRDIGRISARNAIELFGLPAQSYPALAYSIRKSLYVNLTSRCTLACTFCPKVQRRDWWVKGHWLRLRGDPEAEDVLAAIESEIPQCTDLQEIVFVGLGEPTLRLEILLDLGRRLRERHGRRYALRLDTDGLANLVHERDVTPELAEVFDAICVSLNAPDAQTYARLCPSKYGEAAYPAVKDFVRAARRAGLDVVASAVGVPDLDLEATRSVAEVELGVPFQHRVYQQYG